MLGLPHTPYCAALVSGPNETKRAMACNARPASHPVLCGAQAPPPRGHPNTLEAQLSKGTPPYRSAPGPRVGRPGVACCASAMPFHRRLVRTHAQALLEAYPDVQRDFLDHVRRGLPPGLGPPDSSNVHGLVVATLFNDGCHERCPNGNRYRVAALELIRENLRFGWMVCRAPRCIQPRLQIHYRILFVWVMRPYQLHQRVQARYELRGELRSRVLLLGRRRQPPTGSGIGKFKDWLAQGVAEKVFLLKDDHVVGVHAELWTDVACVIQGHILPATIREKV